MKQKVYVVEANTGIKNELHYSLYSTYKLAKDHIMQCIDHAETRNKIYEQVFKEDDFWESKNGDCLSIQEKDLHIEEIKDCPCCGMTYKIF